MGLWTDVVIEVRNPKEQNISEVVKKILSNYDYDETFFKSTYSKENGVEIKLSSTHNLKDMYPIIMDIKKEIKTFSFFTIKSYLL